MLDLGLKLGKLGETCLGGVKPDFTGSCVSLLMDKVGGYAYDDIWFARKTGDG